MHSAAAPDAALQRSGAACAAGADPPAAGRRRQRGDAEVRGRQHRAVAVGTDLPGAAGRERALHDRAAQGSARRVGADAGECVGVSARGGDRRHAAAGQVRRGAVRRAGAGPGAGRARAAANHAAPCAGRRRAAAARARQRQVARRGDAGPRTAAVVRPHQSPSREQRHRPGSRPAAEGLDRHRDGHRRRRPAAPRHARPCRRHARAVAAGQGRGRRARRPAGAVTRDGEDAGCDGGHRTAAQALGLPPRRGVVARARACAARPRGADVCAHRRAGDADRRSLQARPQRQPGLGDDAGPCAAGGRRRCRRQRLPRRDAVVGPHRRTGAGAHSARLRRERFAQRLHQPRRPVRHCARPGACRRQPRPGLRLRRLEPRHRVVALRPADRTRLARRCRHGACAHGVRPHAAARRRDGVDAPSPAPRECPGAGGAGRGGAARRGRHHPPGQRRRDHAAVSRGDGLDDSAERQAGRL